VIAHFIENFSSKDFLIQKNTSLKENSIHLYLNNEEAIDASV
jgi:hypothetical protein